MNISLHILVIRFALLTLLFTTSSVTAQITPTDRILYVNHAVQGGDASGSSWTHAIPQLADALKWAHENKDKELWMYSWNSFPVLVNVTINGNTPTEGEWYNSGGTPVIVNSIVWGMGLRDNYMMFGTAWLKYKQRIII